MDALIISLGRWPTFTPRRSRRSTYTIGAPSHAAWTAHFARRAAVLMLLGYGILAVPTGIVGAELAKSSSPSTNTQACPSCGREGHDDDAVHCKHCGERL